MRSVLFLLILVLVSGLNTVSEAEEPFLCRVLSVDREGGKLSVLLMGDENDADGSVKEEKRVDVTIPKEQLPKDLQPGHVVRIWGGMKSETGVIRATSLQGSGTRRYAKDPTGVRRRIGKSRTHFGGGGGAKGRGRK